MRSVLFGCRLCPMLNSQRDSAAGFLIEDEVFTGFCGSKFLNVIDHLNPRFLNFKRKIDKETSVIFCAVGTELSSFIHLL